MGRPVAVKGLTTGRRHDGALKGRSVVVSRRDHTFSGPRTRGTVARVRAVQQVCLDSKRQPAGAIHVNMAVSVVCRPRTFLVQKLVDLVP